MAENAANFGVDQMKVKNLRSKIEAKIKWIRCLQIPSISRRALAVVLSALKGARKYINTFNSYRLF